MTTKKKTAIPNGNSRAAKNKKIRRDALREQLKAKEYVRMLLGMADKLNPKAKHRYKPEEVPMVNARKDIYFRLLDKCLPSLRPIDQPVKFELSEINTAEDVSKALGAVMKAVANEQLTPNQAKDLSVILEGFVKVLEIVEFEKRLNIIEERTKSDYEAEK